MQFFINNFNLYYVSSIYLQLFSMVYVTFVFSLIKKTQLFYSQMQLYFCDVSNANANAKYVLLHCYEYSVLLKSHNNNNNINILYNFMVSFDMSKFQITSINQSQHNVVNYNHKKVLKMS